MEHKKVDLGSSLQNFMRDALENDEGTEYAPTNSEIKVAQSAKPTKPKKFTKFILMGMAALSLAGPVLAQGHEAPTPGSFQNEAIEMQAQSQKAGLIGQEGHIKVSIINQKMQGNFADLEKLAEGNNSSVTKDNGVCEVNVTYSKDGATDYLGQTEDLAKVSTLQSASELKFNREFVLLHELSHCEFALFQNPILVDGNPQLQKDMNYFFKYSGEVSTDSEAGEVHASDFVQTLNENFADTYSAIQMIKLHGLTPDVKSVLDSALAQRTEKTLFQGKENFVESHDSQNALREILQPETLEKIKNANGAELKHLALEIANHSVQKLYATYTNVNNSAYSLSSLENGINNIVANNFLKEMQPGTDSVQKPGDNAGNSYAIKIAQETLAQLKEEGFSLPHDVLKNGSLKLDSDQANAIYEKVQKNIAKSGNERNSLRATSHEFNNYITSHYKANDADYANAKTSSSEFASKVLAVENNYINTKEQNVKTDYAQSDVVQSKFNIASRIKNMRQAAYAENTMTSSLKMN